MSDMREFYAIEEDAYQPHAKGLGCEGIARRLSTAVRLLDSGLGLVRLRNHFTSLSCRGIASYARTGPPITMPSITSSPAQ